MCSFLLQGHTQITKLHLVIMSPKALLAMTISQTFLIFDNLNLSFLLAFPLRPLVFKQSAKPEDSGRTARFGGEVVMCVTDEASMWPLEHKCGNENSGSRLRGLGNNNFCLNMPGKMKHIAKRTPPSLLCFLTSG